MAETERLAVTKRDAGRGTGDGVKWKGEAPAEPKRQRMATGEQHVGVAISHDGLSATMRHRLSRNPSNCQPLGFSEGQCWADLRPAPAILR
jgi:hypothetical protein